MKNYKELEKEYEEIKKNIKEVCAKNGCAYIKLTIQERLDLSGLKVEDFKTIHKRFWKGCDEKKFTLQVLKNLMFLYTFEDVFFNYNKLLNELVAEV